MTQFPASGDPAEGQYSRPRTEPTPSVEPAPPNGAVSEAPPSQRPLPQDQDRTGHSVVKRSRFGELWIGLIIAAVILVLLLVFVLQNSQTVQVDYFGLTGQLPLAVAILLGVAAGALLVALPGTVRILQLRKAARRQD